MIALFVRAQIKPEMRQKFLEVMEHDAVHSEQDEAGCLRFNVLQDASDENVYYFYEVYKDEAALEAHRAAPHYKVWDDAREEVLAAPTQATRLQPVLPTDSAYWGD